MVEDKVPAPEINVRVRKRAMDMTPHDYTGTIEVERVAYGATHQSSETIRVPIFHTAPARLRVEGGITRNMGDYNSVRVAVAVELPALPERTEIERAYLVASDIVDDLINRELDIATGNGEVPTDGE